MTSTRTPIRFSPEAQAKLDKFPNVVDTSQDGSADQAAAAAFPTSTVRPSQVLQFPGVTYDSTLMVRRLIEEDDRRFHIFGNPSFTHNHLGHHLLTVYSLGASPKQLEATFEVNLDDMAKLDPATHREGDVIQDEAVKRGEKQVVITHDNWNDTTLLGVKSNYPAYLKFFHKEIESIGGMEAFEKYFLSPAANQGPKEKEDKKSSSDHSKAPHMMVRFLSGAFHPWIHIGFGLEFRDRVTLAEGFAQAAIHPSSLMAPLFPETWPIIPSAKGHARRRSSQTIDTDASFIDPRRTHISASNMMGVSSHSSTMVPLTFSTSVTTGYRHLAHPSLLELYAEVCESKEITMPAYDPESSVNQRLKEAHRHGNAEAIRKIADKWGLTEGELVKCGESDGWARRVEELQVLCTLLAVGTGRKGMKTKVDFFLMHTLTSSIFLPSFLIHLTAPHRLVLLKSYLYVVFHLAIARGRPRIDPTIILDHTEYPCPPSHQRSQHDDKPTDKDSSSGRIVGVEGDSTYGNFWTRVVDNALHAQDSHVPKSIRALLLYSRLYGHLPAGSLLGTYKSAASNPSSHGATAAAAGNDREETIPGISKLGGDVFARAVGIVFAQTGWPDDQSKGDAKASWDFSALGFDETWKDEDKLARL